MKFGIFAVIAFVLMFATMSFAGPFGPADPTADVGKFSASAGYWFDRTKMSDNGKTYTESSHQYYAKGTYTFIKDWEVYGKFGLADMKLRNDDVMRSGTDNTKPFGGLGLKGVVYRNGYFSVGPFAEGNMYSSYKGLTNQWDVNAGVSAAYRFLVSKCLVTVYGGPFMSTTRADLKGSGTLKEYYDFGGFAGVSVPITQKVFASIEGQLKDKLGSSYGVSVGYKF